MSCSDVAMQQPAPAACGAPRYAAAPGCAQKKLAVYNKMQESLEVTLPSKQEEDEKDQPAEMEYLNSRCVLFTYFQGDIGSVVDEHFSRALSQASSFNSETALSKSKAGLNPLWRESSAISSQRSGFPTSFWTSSYQPPPPPPCLSGVHPDFPVTAPGTFPAADASGWPGHGLHQSAGPAAPAASEPWHYPLASQVSPSYAHMHEVYVHHPHVHPQHPGQPRDPRYGSLLVPSLRAARIPGPQQGGKADPAAGSGATSAWAGAFHGTVDIVPTFGFDTGLQHQDKSKETAWF
ncbi:PREDICTED: transcription cofactor vestigial-like protein 3 isoform X1 [Pseudopodoces humilis]|uniref:transcription cofactor vestigial-like protein 3 isoform X1 n=2 Tax=Pseudopodoces humilis TaxID=181119 RepID=UPI000395E20B|nr:PREDICTED: transcription cofactor vestigial-like protein 3 isoform X1 [Pseudopodoces humilis]